jgi:hypothetical protein
VWLSDDDLPFALAFVALCAFAFVLPAQSDTFYHLRSGREMWERGWFLEREVFSHTAKGQPLHNHWWLSQLLLYGLYSAGGAMLVTVGAGACALLAVYLSWRLVRGTLEARVLLGLALILVFPQWSVRPQVFSMLMLMIVVRLVLADRLRWVPAVLLVWANAHALVVLGILVPVAAAIEAFVWSRHRLRPAILTAVAGAVVPTVSPLGWHYWPRAFETVRESRLLGIQEYRPAFSGGIDVLGIWLLLLVLVVMVVRSASRLGRVEAGDRVLLLTAGIFGLAAVTSVRNAGFFALVAVPAISRFVPPAELRPSRPFGRPAIVLVGAAAVLAGVFVVFRWRDGGARLGWKPITPAAMEAIRSCPGPMFNTFDQGGVLTWFVPEQPVFVDGRVEAYPKELLRRAARASLSADYKELFVDYNIRCAAVSTGSRLAQALRTDQEMRITFVDNQWSVFVRVDQPHN